LQHQIVRAKGRFVKKVPIRAALVVVAALVGAAAPGRALAQDAGVTTLSAADFFLSVQYENGVNIPPFDLKRFFNKAACDCDIPVKIYASLSAQGFAKRSRVDQTARLSIWLGNTACDNVLVQNSNCVRLIDEALSEFFAHGREVFSSFEIGGQKYPLTARTLSTYTGTTGVVVDGGAVAPGGGFRPNTDCTAPISPFNQTIWLLVDTNGDSANDISPPATTAVRIDLQGPTAPENVQVRTGNEAVNVSWNKLDVTTGGNGDLQGYQVLCQRGGGTQVFPNGTFTTPIKSCEKNRVPGLEGLDPLFVCSPLLNRSTSSYRVKILQNDIWYGAGVVAIDDSGNASKPILTRENFAQPAKTESFYDVYREGDNNTAGAATGGYCAVAPADAERPVWGVAAGATLACAAVLALRRRRRRP
jgi:hypothetical protein